jgi:DNA-directed RNA polymerase subunit RPC12/RpoP
MHCLTCGKKFGNRKQEAYYCSNCEEWVYAEDNPKKVGATEKFYSK